VDEASLNLNSKQTLVISLPGKTFLVGEYLALMGGPSFVLATAPRFELKIRKKEEQTGLISATVNHLGQTKSLSQASQLDQLHEMRKLDEADWPFNEKSPAGLLLAAHRDLAQSYEFSFFDPHQGLGGLGASTAQFAAVWIFIQLVCGDDTRLVGTRQARAGYVGNLHVDNWREADWQSLLAEYRQYAWTGEGLAPSGADLVAQMSGGITRFEGLTSNVQKFAWDFSPRSSIAVNSSDLSSSSIEFSLIRTGHKLATHEHLRSAVSTSLDIVRFRRVSEMTTEAFATLNADLLVDSVNCMAQSLADSGLVAPETLALLNELRGAKVASDADDVCDGAGDNGAASLVRAAKGCGAMGADIVLVLHNREHRAELHEWVRQRGLLLCGTSEDLGAGLKVGVAESEDSDFCM
jgi:mevalonate kinase